MHFQPVVSFRHFVTVFHFVSLPPSTFLHFSTRFQCPTAGVALSFLTTNSPAHSFFAFLLLTLQLCKLCNFFRFSSLPKKQSIFPTLHLCDSFIRHPCILSSPFHWSVPFSREVFTPIQFFIQESHSTLNLQKLQFSKLSNLQNGNLAIWQNVQPKLLYNF